MRRSPLALVLGPILVTACVTEPPYPPVVVEVRVVPATMGLIVSQTANLVASAFDIKGRQLPIQKGLIAWSSDAPAVASVSDSGFVTALMPGVAEVSASVIVGSRVIVGKTRVTVDPDAVETMRIDGPPVIPLGIVARYAVMGVTKLGKLVPLSPLSPYRWSTGDPEIATVVEGGVFGPARGIFGQAEGTTEVYASRGTTRLARTIFVLPFRSQLAVAYGDGKVIVRSLENDNVAYEGSVLTGPIDLTPDGRGLSGGCPEGICTVQLSTGDRSVTASAGVGSPSWSAAGRMVYLLDGFKIAYIGPGDTAGYWTARFYVMNPKVSNDGRLVLYDCDIEGTYDIPDLCIVDLTDPRPDVLVSRLAGRSAWAPDRAEFVWVRGRTIMRQKLGETAYPILVVGENIHALTWGTDDWLAFSTGNRIWLVRADGSHLTPWWHDREVQVTGLSWR